MINKHIKIPFTVYVFAVCLLFVQPVRAQLVAGVTFDAAGDAKATAQTVVAQINAVQEGVVATVKENMTKLKAGIEKYAGKINKLISKIPGSKDIDENSSVDICKADAVQTAFTELFLQYPSTDSRVNKAYEMKAQQFYYDTLVEMRTAIVELESQLANLRTDVEQFGEETLSGKGNSEGADDENGTNYSAYLANRKFNDILKITEQLVAMRNQYYAARLLRQPQIVNPAPYPTEDKTTSEDTKKTSFIYGHSRVGFAQLMPRVKAVASKMTSPKTAELKTITLEKAETVDVKSQSAEKTVETAAAKTAAKLSDLFMVPEAPETSALLQGSETELAALSKVSEAQKIVNEAVKVHNALQQLPGYKDLYKQYSLFRQLHAKAVEAVKNADQCVIKYVGRRYDNPNSVWFGQDNEPENTCDYNGRKGLSGWTIAAFQVANASVGNDIDVDAFAETDIDLSQDSKTLTEENSAQLEAQNSQISTDNLFASPSKAQEFSDSIREVELLNWQIGRKAAQYLVEDQYSEKPVYGKAAHPYPLWNDQRSYYNQYLDGKYANMKAYLNKLDLSDRALEIAEILNNSESESDEKAANLRGLNQISSALKKKPSSSSGTTKLLAAKAEALTAIKKKETAALAPYEAKITDLNEQIDAWSSMINSTTAKINKVDENVKLNEGRAETAQKDITYMNERGTNSSSSTFNLAKQTLATAGNEQAEGITKLGKLRVEVSKYKTKRDKLTQEKTATEEKIKTISQKYQEDIIAVENEYDAQIAAIQSDSDVASKLVSIYSSLKLKNSSLKSLLSKADDLVNKARGCAETLIEKHQEDLSAMKNDDALYLKTNNAKVVAKHAALIESMKNLPKTCFSHDVQKTIGIRSANPDSIISLLTDAFKSALTKSVCSNYACDKADTQYFVGLPAKARDFTAPKAPLTAHYPAVRDMVHLDTTDYKKIEMSQDGRLSRTAFLNYGITQPYVWQLMLSDKAYIERGMDLSAALNLGGEGKSFMRGNLLPCRSGTYMIDALSVGKYEITDTQTQSSANNKKMLETLSDCRELHIVNRVLGVAKLIDTYVIKDTDVDSKVLGNAGGEISNPTSSELGMFLRYKSGSLQINERPHQGYGLLIAKEKNAEKTGKYDLNAEDNMYQRAMFSKNQIGDFLHFVDKETRIKKNVDEIQASMDEIKTGLKELFEQMGFSLKDDLDLAKSSDYDYVIKKLKERKNILVSEAGAELDTINHANATVKERFDKVDNTYSALVQDSKALVNLSANTQAGGPLAESIKTEETNQKVIEKARNEGYAAIQKEIDNYEQPICMPY